MCASTTQCVQGHLFSSYTCVGCDVSMYRTCNGDQPHSVFTGTVRNHMLLFTFMTSMLQEDMFELGLNVKTASICLLGKENITHLCTMLPVVGPVYACTGTRLTRVCVRTHVQCCMQTQALEWAVLCDRVRVRMYV